MRAFALALVPLLSGVPAYAEPLPRIDMAAYCRSIQATNMLTGTAEQKYEGCLALERLHLKSIEARWSLLSEKEQGVCVREGALNLNRGYTAIGFCVFETMRNRARALSYEEERGKSRAAPKPGSHD